MSKKNKKRTQQDKQTNVNAQEEHVAADMCNTAEVSFADEEQLVAGEEQKQDECQIDDSDIDVNLNNSNEQAMEFDYYEQQLSAERSNLEMYKNMAQQLQADFDNYRKRNANIAKESRQEGELDAVKAMLPAYDALVEGIKMVTDENTKTGLEMVERMFLQSLSSLNIQPIQAVGQEFDPKIHNAIMTEEAQDVEEGIVIDEFSKGFVRDDGTVVRVATVKVSR
ncbi:MAG: nucleotide exchange factor GrpE [Clostridia bacterium]|nr:nucleotide exchange factor GrpE [Clostridia bacterium]